MWLGRLIKGYSQNDPLGIKQKIDDCRKKGATKLSIDVYMDDMIVFQIHPITNFTQFGLKAYNPKDKVLSCFFHKGKKHVEHVHQKYKVSDWCYFENPKGIHSYAKNIGFDSEIIAKEIYSTIEFFEIANLSELILEYKEY
jgi:hypothetical protein